MNTEVESPKETMSIWNLQEDSPYILAVTFAVLIWSTSFVATKIAYDSFAPLTLGALRFAVATLILGIIQVINKEIRKPSLRDMGLLSLSGMLGITAYSAAENIGLKLTTASNAALITASFPAITALLELLIYKIKISWVKALGIAMAVLGVYQIVNSNQGDIAGQHLAGNLILTSTGVVWAFYNFITMRVVKKYSMITISFYQTVAGTIAFIPLALTEKASWRMPSLKSFLVLLFLGVFCSVLAFLLYNFGLRKLSSSTAVMLLNLIPVFGVLFSALLLNEAIGIAQLAGGAIVIAGVILSVRK